MEKSLSYGSIWWKVRSRCCTTPTLSAYPFMNAHKYSIKTFGIQTAELIHKRVYLLHNTIVHFI